MSVTIYVCTTCERDVHLDSDAPPYCPVCSSPLVVAAPIAEQFALVSGPAPAPPEIYLG